MSGPWEKYSGGETQGAKPWEKFGAEPEADESMDGGPGISERIARAGLRTLPAVGALGGGFLATPTGPVGMVAGATGGAIAGKSLQDTLENMIFDDKKTRGEFYSDLAKEGLTGATAEMGGQVLAQVPHLAKEGIDSARGYVANKMGGDVSHAPVANADVIEEAAKAIGVKAPKAVTSSNPLYQDFESGLAQSGSLPARSVRKEYDEFWKGLDEAGEKIANLRSGESNFSLGGQIRNDLTEQVASRKAPVSQLYEDILPDMRKIPVNGQVVNRVFGDLKKNPIFQTKDGIAMLEEMKGVAASQPELASLKEWRSTLRDAVGPSASPLEEKRYEAIRNAVTAIRDNTINATKAEFPKGMHKEVDSLIDQVALADRAFAGNVEDINGIRGILGNKEIGSPTTFINKLSAAPEADLFNRASSLDIASLRRMQEKFPSVFEKAKTAKINDMIQGATNPSGFSEVRFFKQYGEMDQELKELLFAPEMRAHIESLNTVRQAIPKQLGPSGTPKGLMTMDAFGPKRNVMDYGIKKVLEGAARPATPIAPASLPANVLPMNRAAPILQSIPRSIQAPNYPTSIPRAAEDQSFNEIHDKDAIVSKLQGTKYQQVLQNAANNGDQSFNAAHYVLSQRDPEYRKALEGE